jgi:hypothetical protein
LPNSEPHTTFTVKNTLDVRIFNEVA